MILPKIPLAGTLLLSYAVYSTFVPVSIPHSIILFSLAAFAALEQYLNSHKTPSILQEVERVKEELLKEMQKTKETYELRLAELKQEQQRINIDRANEKASVPSKKPTIKF